MIIDKNSYKEELKRFRKYIRSHSSELGCYVYALVDSSAGRKQVFYVGKGQNERMFSHVFESFATKDFIEEELIGKKLERIRKIHESGNKVEMYILHYGLTNEHAFIVESVLIDVFSNFREIDVQAFGELTNAMNGFDHRKGFSSIESLCNSANAKEEIKILPNEKLLAIKISGTETKDDEILERVRKHWRINPQRADKATYIAACRNGVVIGLYINKSGWLQVQNPANPDDEGRYYFEGVPVADDSVLQRFINRLVVIPKGARYPIMYIGGWH